MERRPLRLLWRTDRLAHGVIGVLSLLLALPLAVAFLVFHDLVAFLAMPVQAVPPPLLRIAMHLPAWAGADGPWIALPGWSLARTSFIELAIGLLILCLTVTVLIGAAVLAFQSSRASRVLGDLSDRLGNLLLRAEPRADVDLQGFAARAVAAMAALRPALRGGVAMPALAGATAFTALLALLVLSVWLVPAALLVAALLVAGDVAGRNIRDAARTRQERLDDALARRLHDRLVRWPFLRAHGAVAAERLALAGLAPPALAGKPAFLLLVLDLVRLILFLAGPAIVALAPALARIPLSPADWITAMVAAGLFAGATLVIAASRERLLAGRIHAQELAGIFAALRLVKGPVPAAGTPDIGTMGRGATLLTAPAMRLSDPERLIRVDVPALDIAGLSDLTLVSTDADGTELVAATWAGLRPLAPDTVSLGGFDPAALPLETRAAAIGYVARAPLLLPGSLADNLLHGAPAGLADDRAAQRTVLALTGLSDHTFARALASSLNGDRHRRLTDAIVPLRREIREAIAGQGLTGQGLTGQGLTGLGLAGAVDPFDPARFNRHATIAENILFGEPVGDTFAAGSLARHPFFRAVLEAEDLTQTFVDKGHDIAEATLEMFAGIPDDHPLFARFAFFPADQRDDFAAIAGRGRQRRRGGEGQRDRDRLIGLTLGYVESRHRLGLIDAALEERLVQARRTFASLLPPPLRPAIDLYDPDRVCRPASLADNLLFGRIAYDLAGAGTRALAFLTDIIDRHGLRDAVLDLGLDAPPLGRTESSSTALAWRIDLGRCLMRRPPVLVFGRVPADLGPSDLQNLASSLHAGLPGTRIIWGLDPAQEFGLDGPRLVIEGNVLREARGS
jgi:hypothetical protein